MIVSVVKVEGRALINIDIVGTQLSSRLFNLLHQLLVRSGHVVEGEDAVAESEEEICAKGDD